jgi:hypothetical protein
MDMPKRTPRYLLVLAVLLFASLSVSAICLGRSQDAAHPSKVARAHSASSYLTGIGDEQPQMFTNPLWLQLHTKIVRYIAPYDVAAGISSLQSCYHHAACQAAARWIELASATHQRVLVAFYHSERSPTRLPSVGLYERDVRAFIKLFPAVHEYQAWNEANRGNVRHLFSSPSPSASAQYYQALKRDCRRCTVVGLDILDGQNIAPTLRYIAEFKRQIGRLHTIMPSVWGLHNYSDTNRFSTLRTRAVLAAVPGQVWLTETGGVVQFGGAFPNHHGSGLIRAARALQYMFRIAASQSRIRRLYIFQWSGATASARFDAGLMDPHYKPRQGYVVVCGHLHAAKCHLQVSKR